MTRSLVLSALQQGRIGGEIEVGHVDGELGLVSAECMKCKKPGVGEIADPRQKKCAGLTG